MIEISVPTVARFYSFIPLNGLEEAFYDGYLSFLHSHPYLYSLETLFESVRRKKHAYVVVNGLRGRFCDSVLGIS